MRISPYGRATRILIFLNHLRTGGAERVTLNLATKWRDSGADVTIAVLFSDKHNAYSVPSGIHFTSLNILGKPNSILSVLRNNIVPLIVIRRLLRRERPDIAIGAMTISPIGLALARTGDEIAIGHEHIHPPSSFSNWKGIFLRVWNFVRCYSYARLDAVVALTPQSATWLRENTRARKVVAIPNWISLPLPDNEPKVAPEDIIPADKKLLIATGRLHPQKRFDRLLNAFAPISSRYPDWHLAILGEGDLHRDLKAQVIRLDLSKQVHLPGFVGNVADWYRAADALAMTSDYEGFPMVLLEAMAHGCPVISVDCDTGPRDIIRNNENGLLVPQDDINALVDGLDRMLSDNALRARLASKAVEVLETYSPARVNAAWQDLFDDLRQKRNPRTKGV